MKMKPIITAIEMILKTTPIKDLPPDIYDSYISLKHAARHMLLDEDDFVSIHMGAFMDLIMKATYDGYGRQRRLNDNKEISFNTYRERVLPCDMEAIPTQLLYAGYEFTSDLWHDNDTANPDGDYGYNRDDGSFAIELFDGTYYEEVYNSILEN